MPEGFSVVVEDLLEEVEDEWYENEYVGYRIFNLRERVLRNPTLDPEILAEEFLNSGDVGNISAILNNPICPREFLEQIINSEHLIFDAGEHEDLIEEAQELLANRK
jgi:hypothetical protein